jgi:thioredoxin reductase
VNHSNRKSEKHEGSYDVIVIGGGPAGLSAALLLGRCGRRVLVCDASEPRNASSHAMHGFLGEDGVSPIEFLVRAREQLSNYQSVELMQIVVGRIEREGIGFLVESDSGRGFLARSVMLATGLVDVLPEIPGVHEFYGVSLHHCPYCDAWEHRGKRLGVLGDRADSVRLVVLLRLWSKQLTLFTHGGKISNPALQARLRSAGVVVVEGGIHSLRGDGAELREVVMESGSRHPCDALFFSPHEAESVPLAKRMGCLIEHSSGRLKIGAAGETSVQGLFVAGNAPKDIQMTIVAAAEGVKAAVACNEWLLEADQSYLSSGG